MDGRWRGMRREDGPSTEPSVADLPSAGKRISDRHPGRLFCSVFSSLSLGARSLSSGRQILCVFLFSHPPSCSVTVTVSVAPFLHVFLLFSTVLLFFIQSGRFLSYCMPLPCSVFSFNFFICFLIVSACCFPCLNSCFLCLAVWHLSLAQYMLFFLCFSLCDACIFVCVFLSLLLFPVIVICFLLFPFHCVSIFVFCLFLCSGPFFALDPHCMSAKRAGSKSPLLQRRSGQLTHGDLYTKPNRRRSAQVAQITRNHK